MTRRQVISFRLFLYLSILLASTFCEVGCATLTYLIAEWDLQLC